MSVLTILQGPWAIRPETLSMMWDIYEARVTRGGRLSAEELHGIEAATGKRLDGSRLPVLVQDGVAVIPVMGPLIPRANLFQEISGATSYQMIRDDVDTALRDPDVRALLFNIDSPGGSVNQLYDLAAFIRKADGVKPVGAWTDGSMTSAAQLIGAATGVTWIGSDSADLGSIGVLTMHRDISKAEEMRGEKTTIIASGKYKDVGHPFGALSEEHRGMIQDRLDYLYTSFVDAIAGYRNIDRKKVAEELADARIFTGRQAIDAGLADAMMSFDDAVAAMRDRGRMPMKHRSANGGKATAEISDGGKHMNRAELQEQHPALLADILEEGRTAGATAERERITAILNLPGAGAVAYRDLLMQGVKDGKTSGDVAQAILQKDAAVRDQAAKDLDEGKNKPAPHAESGDETAEAQQKTSLIAAAAAAGSAKR